MEHTVSTWDIILNVLLGAINIAVFFFFFVKFIGKPLGDALIKRVEKEKKLADADQAYERLMTQAQEEKEELIKEAQLHKESLLQEAQLLVAQKYEDILQKAHIQAERITDDAKNHRALQEQELHEGFIEGVKQMTERVVQKLIKQDPHLEKKYVEQLVQEFAQ